MRGLLYSRALRDGDLLEAVYPDGTRVPLPVESWRGPPIAGDGGLLDRCAGATLDVGCGPGRLAAALRQRGVAAVGIDVNDEAVRLARAAGASVQRCSIFSAAVPRPGRWDTVLLADGNIGIGGLPVVLLRRVADLMRPTGRALVEVEGPEASSRWTRVRVASGAHVSPSFPWAHLGLRDVHGSAALAGLRVVETWTDSGRWFAALVRS